MDFSKLLNQQLNSMLGGNMNTSMEGGGPLVWIVVALVVVGAVGVYLYMNEYFGCSSGRLAVDGKCVNLCPEGETFKSADTEKKVAKCTKGDKVNEYGFPTPTPAPTTTPAPVATTSAAVVTTPAASSTPLTDSTKKT